MELQDLERMVANEQRQGRSSSLSAAFPALMRKVYVWMALALVITGICAYGVATSPTLMQMVYGNRAAIWVLFIAEIGLVFYTTARINRLSLSTATTLFIVYSALNGVTLSGIFLSLHHDIHRTGVLHHSRYVRRDGTGGIHHEERPHALRRTADDAVARPHHRLGG